MSSYPCPPPPRRSRSRSPLRGAYPSRPPFPEQDPYRPEYEYYDRYNKEGYDYGRRGRSRSPPLNESSRKRRRSLSPYERERYDPRPRYEDYDPYRGYGYSPSRRGHSSYSLSRRPPPPDPHHFDYPASLKQFAEWFRYYYPDQAQDEDNADKVAEQEAGDGSKPRNGIRSKWEKYKKDFAAKQLQTMFDHHRKSPWFAEKYDPAPEYQKMRMRVRKEGWKGRLSSFLADLESGKFDPDLNELNRDTSSLTKEPNGDSVFDTNGAVATSEDKPSGDEDIQFNMDAEDDPADNDVPRTDTNGKSNGDNKRNTRGEEVSVLPEDNQVMIRTIPPDIGRAKLEDACSKIPGFVYLALGDPLQKRNYYRAGWLRFRQDADMGTVMTELAERKIEGFKLHVSHSTKPFTSRLRYAPEVASRPERLEKDFANVKNLAGLLEEEAAVLRKMKVTDSAAAKNTESDDAVMADTDADAEEEEPYEKGSDAVERRIERIMSDMRNQGLVDVNDEKDYEAKKTVVSLDLYIAYIRAAYHTCYYCCVTTDHLEELQRKCLKHVRKPLSSKAPLDEVKTSEAEKVIKDSENGQDQKMEKEATKSPAKMDNREWKRNDEKWLEWFDSKIALLINRDGVDPRDYGGKSYDEELSKIVEPHIKQEDEGKYRCKTCTKLFKATSFVEKHISNKHSELVKGLEDLSYFNNFALDPHRIQPFAHPPTTFGSGSSQAPPQAFGIQAPAASFHPGYYDRYDSRPLYGYYPPPSNGHYDHNMYPNPNRRDDAASARRLSERISGFVPDHAAAGLPAKPMVSPMDSPLLSGSNARRGTRSGVQSGAPPPPPPDAKEDPRAAAGKRVSYHDMDLVAEGDVELSY